MKRRNVVRVAVFYIVSAWLILQVIDVVGEILALPEWLGKAVLLLIAVGFVPALLFSWIYEMTPEGLKREKDVVRDESITHVTARKLDQTVIVLLVAVLALLGYQQFRSPGPIESPAPAEAQVSAVAETPESPPQQARAPGRSIAVLPFANRSNREEDLFFTDGMHDDLLTQLAKVASLTVISRTSVMRYRDTEMSIPEIASQLGVANILEGGIQRAGDQVRINVQLIEADTDRHLWAETYDRLLTADNLFAIQSEITREIMDALKASLTPEEAERIAQKPTENLEAFQEFMRGQQLLPLRTVAAIEEGKAHFENALGMDPGFPEAMVGLANALHLMNEYAGWPPEDSLVPAMDLVDQALERSPNLAEAYMVKGELWRHRREFDQAEGAFEKALELAPGSATTHQWYGMLAGQQNQTEKAFSLMRRAHQLDPMSPIIHANYALIPFRLGKDEMALQELDRLQLLHPDYPTAHSYESWIRWVHGDIVGTLKAMRKAAELDPGSTRASWLCGSYIDMNAMPEAGRCFQDFEGPQDIGFHHSRAIYHVLRGDASAAMAELNAILDNEQGKVWGAGAGLALDLGQIEVAHERFAVRHPAWFGEEPLDLGSEFDVDDAVEVAEVLIHEGRGERAEQLLELAVDAMSRRERNRGETAFGLNDIRAFTLLGDRERALAAMESVADMAYLTDWQTFKVEPVFEPLRDDLRFTAALAKLEQAAQVELDRARSEGLL